MEKAYREINKGLIEHNQELRIQNGLLQKEITLMRSQLMDERSKRVMREKQLKIVLISNIRKALNILDPEMTLVDVLELENNDDDDVADTSLTYIQKPKKSHILQELRRSNSLQRRSSIIVSPIKSTSHRSEPSLDKSNNETRSIDEDKVTSQDGSSTVNAEMSAAESISANIEDNIDVIEENVAVLEKDATNRTETLSLITEEDCGGNESLASSADSTREISSACEEDLQELPIKRTKPIRRRALSLDRSPLKDIGNIVADAVEAVVEEEEQQQQHNRIKTHADWRTAHVVQRRKQHNFFQDKIDASIKSAEKNYELCATEISDAKNCGSNIDVSDAEEAVVEEEQHKRIKTPADWRRAHVAQRRKQHNFFQDKSDAPKKSAEINYEHCATEISDAKSCRANSDIGATTMAFSELTISHFAEALSSTPNGSSNVDSEMEKVGSSEQSMQRRAPRRCKPKCLAEPKINTKMRNELSANSNSRRIMRKKK